MLKSPLWQDGLLSILCHLCVSLQDSTFQVFSLTKASGSGAGLLTPLDPFLLRSCLFIFWCTDRKKFSWIPPRCYGTLVYVWMSNSLFKKRGRDKWGTSYATMMLILPLTLYLINLSSLKFCFAIFCQQYSLIDEAYLFIDMKYL